MAHWRARDAERRRADQFDATLAVAVRARQQLERDTGQAARLAAESTAHAGVGAIPDLNRALADWRDLTRRIETIALEHGTATICARALNSSTRN